MSSSRWFVLVLALLPLSLIEADAQYPRMVDDERTGVFDLFLDQGEANALRAELAHRVLDAGYDTVTQTPPCGPRREELPTPGFDAPRPGT